MPVSFISLLIMAAISFIPIRIRPHDKFSKIHHEIIQRISLLHILKFFL
ncbi:Uncharacterised protein [Legionella spiritensis]|nr:Uncharacterised protein [Legionella spiritensis]